MSSPKLAELDGVSIVHDYGDVGGEYDAARTGAALYDHRLRGLIQVTGKDRAAWLHNLVTNAVKTLEPAQGAYAFALNVKGRILFDVNVLILPDAIWLDIDRRLLARALSHLDRYIIAEDVQLEDRSNDFARFALLGPLAAQIADALGATQIESLPPLHSASATLVQKNRLMVRHDLAGPFGSELYVEAADAQPCWNRLLEIGAPVQLRPIGHAAVEMLRIEAGIPASVREINEDVLPAETGQLARAVSFTKGCYLGQEVVERMRSHQVLARRLAGVRLSGPAAAPASLLGGGAEVGRLTSVCESPRVGAWIGLAYLKLAAAAEATLQVASDPPLTAVVSALPFAPP